jgi:hypothetical protein
MPAQPLFEIKAFRGKNNVADPTRILPSEGASYLSEALNVDIDNEFMLHRRKGYGEPVYPARSVHSLYSHAGTCLFVQGSDLKRLRPDYSSQILREGVGDARMSYAGFQDRIYYTNSSVIGYVKDGLSHTFPEPNQTFKSRMKPGQLIEWFNGRLYVGRGGILWFSDPVSPGQTDERRNFKNLGGYISMLRAVRDGMFISNGRATYFLSGLDPQEFSMVKVDDETAIPGTDAILDGGLVGDGEVAGRVILWLSPGGICLGAAEGTFRKISKDFYRTLISFTGASIVRKNERGFYQYLVSQKSFGGTLDAYLPHLDISAAGLGS